jgi:hypothetical protein
MITVCAASEKKKGHGEKEFAMTIADMISMENQLCSGSQPNSLAASFDITGRSLRTHSAGAHPDKIGVRSLTPFRRGVPACSQFSGRAVRQALAMNLVEGASNELVVEVASTGMHDFVRSVFRRRECSRRHDFE